MADGGPPDIIEQKSQINPLHQKTLIKGEIWYLIDSKWFKQWKKYVGYDSWDACNAGHEDLHPGPVDNSGILKEEDPSQLRDHLIDELDYILLPKDGWEKMSSWYGTVEGQEPVARKVVEHGMFVKRCKVEVYLTEFKLCENSKLDRILTAKFSKGDTIDTIEKEMRALFDISEEKETRLWNKYMSNSYEPLHEKTKTVQDAELYQGQLLVIEQKNDDGSWSRQLPTTTAYSKYITNSGSGKNSYGSTYATRGKHSKYHGSLKDSMLDEEGHTVQPTSNKQFSSNEAAVNEAAVNEAEVNEAAVNEAVVNEATVNEATVNEAAGTGLQGLPQAAVNYVMNLESALKETQLELIDVKKRLLRLEGTTDSSSSSLAILGEPTLGVTIRLEMYKDTVAKADSGP